MKKIYIYLALIMFAACNNNNSANNGSDSTTQTFTPPPSIAYTIVNTFPHDTSSYTQGLIWYNNALYEGTGREGGFSKIAKVNLTTGKASQEQYNPKDEFGEGITIFNNKI